MRLVWVGRGAMMLMVAAAIGLSLYFGQTKGGIFNAMADYNAYLVPGVIVAYVAGILQPFVTPHRVAGLHPGRPVACRSCFEQAAQCGFDHDLQAFHRAALATLACYVVLVLVSLATQHERDSEREQYTWGRFKRRGQGDDDALRPWWQNDKLWAGAAGGLHAVDVLVLSLGGRRIDLP